MNIVDYSIINLFVIYLIVKGILFVNKYFPLKMKFYQNTSKRYAELMLMKRYDSELIRNIPEIKYLNLD